MKKSFSGASLIFVKAKLLFFLLSLTLIPLEAKNKNYTQGYIITNEGDTIPGQVMDRTTGSFPKLYAAIRFKSENSLFKKKYGPDEILGYVCGDRHYDSMPLREESAFFKFRYHVNEGAKRVFLKVVLKNEVLTYYQWEYIDADNGYQDYVPLFYRSGSDEMVRVTQGVLGLKRKRLMEYFGDCPDMIAAIEGNALNGITDVYYFYLDSCMDP
jgi:hypothetical protein